MDEATKKFIIICLAVLLVLGGLGGAAWWFWGDMNYKTYSALKDGIEIKYPKGWEVADHPNAGVIAVFKSPLASALEIFRDNVNIATTDLSKDPMTMERYAKVTVDQMTTVFNNVKVLETGPVKLAGHPAHKFVFEANMEAKMVIVVYAILYRDVAYNLTYMGLANRYKERLPVFQHMVDSLKVYF